MGIYYYKMWERIEQAGYSQIAFARRIKMSSATLNKMRNNEYVSMEIIDRVREELSCDYGDLLSSVPKSTEDVTEYKAVESSSSATDKARIILEEYMRQNDMTAADVARETSMSLNTVKGYLKGKALSAQSHVKLMRLGEEYQKMLENALKTQIDKKADNKVFCKKCGSRGNACWGAQSVWIPEKNKYERYCAFGFEQLVNEDGEVYSQNACPHPTNMHEFEKAKQKYPYHTRHKIYKVNNRNGEKWYESRNLSDED